MVFDALDAEGKSHLWLASLDRRFPTRQVSTIVADRPRFAPGGDLFFRSPEGSSNFIFRMKDDGSGLQKVMSNPILELAAVSPDG